MVIYTASGHKYTLMLYDPLSEKKIRTSNRRISILCSKVKLYCDIIVGSIIVVDHASGADDDQLQVSHMNAEASSKPERRLENTGMPLQHIEIQHNCC